MHGRSSGPHLQELVAKEQRWRSEVSKPSCTSAVPFLDQDLL
jgi:hypothetical protein